MTRTLTKTATLTPRGSPEVRDMLANAAEADGRSLANMLEIMVIEYCQRRSIVGNPKTTEKREM